MMSDIDIKLLGANDLRKIFKGLDQKTSNKVLKRVLSDAANPLVKAARQNIPVRRTKIAPHGAGLKKRGGRRQWHPAGLGKKSPTKKMGNSPTATVFVGPRAGVKGTRTDTYYLRFWEEGTKKMPGRWGFRRAYNENKMRVERDIAKSIGKILEREINKHAKR